MRIAIYEPEPRICGPDAWAAALRVGFVQLGHECDVVTFTRSGKPREKWGRIKNEAGSSQSCALRPTRCEPESHAGETLDEYDLIVLTDVKTPPADNAALNAGEMWPNYVDALATTKTPFTSALHGKWYFEEHETPVGLTMRQGSPFIGDLLSLDNFTGFLVEHASDFHQHCAALRSTRRTLLPLPYVPRYSDECVDEMIASRPAGLRLGVIGRMIPTKNRHVLDQILVERTPDVFVAYGGAVAVTNGPSSSYILWEQLVAGGFTGTVLEGTRRSVRWAMAKGGSTVEFRGAYEHPAEVLRDVHAHLGVTDCGFSGGLLEFATLEAIDCGCVPIVTRPFVPHAGGDFELVVIERGFESMGPKTFARHPEHEAIADEILDAVRRAHDKTGYVRHNRGVLRDHHDPRRHARAFLKGALGWESDC